MSVRLTYFIGFLVVCSLLLTSVYLQLFAGVIPCALCTLQRITFGLLGIIFLVGLFSSSTFFGRFFINFFSCLTSLLGMLLAGRQIWLQNFPTNNSSECGVSLQYMMHVLPFNEVLQKILTGSAECRERGWEFLHLNMAEWALIWFVLFFLLSIHLFLREFNGQKK